LANPTSIIRYNAAKTYANDYEIVDKKYVDDLVASYQPVCASFITTTIMTTGNK